MKSIKSYGLKTIAQWIGFRWSQVGVDGPRALLWWRQWRGLDQIERVKSKKLKRIFNYNHEDCLATWKVAKWLMENS